LAVIVARRETVGMMWRNHLLGSKHSACRYPPAGANGATGHRISADRATGA